ncbi:hypothetical protein QJQ45_011205 [Haematococcus lacustris]|nr:hypothetical protein QJQ45_011205 [Haematococcus lacustris]
MARRRAAEAEAKSQAGAAEAEAPAQADAGAYKARLHQLQADLQKREQQVVDTQRLQHLQQQLQDLQQDELQRKEQQVAEQQQQLQQQQADMHLREQQVAQQQHQVQQQQADLQKREQQVAQQQHQVHQQQADLQKREQQVAQQQQGAAVLTDWANKHFAVPCHAQDTSASHRLRGHIMFRRYLVLDDARQAAVCSMPEADVERMHDDVKGCRAMHRMVFTPDREQPQWAMAACACSTCMSVPCLPCIKPDTTTPLEPMPMFQDTVKEVREDEECYALLMLFHSDLLHDEVCFGKLTNKHCERYRMHMGWKRQEGRRALRRLVRRELQSEQLEAEYEADN